MQDGVEYEKVIERITSKIRAGYYTVKSLPIIITLWPSVNKTLKTVEILKYYWKTTISGIGIMCKLTVFPNNNSYGKEKPGDRIKTVFLNSNFSSFLTNIFSLT